MSENRSIPVKESSQWCTWTSNKRNRTTNLNSLDDRCKLQKRWLCTIDWDKTRSGDPVNAEDVRPCEVFGSTIFSPTQPRMSTRNNFCHLLWHFSSLHILCEIQQCRQLSWQMTISHAVLPHKSHSIITVEIKWLSVAT